MNTEILSIQDQFQNVHWILSTPITYITGKQQHFNNLRRGN